jgi:hypothetical protein
MKKNSPNPSITCTPQRVILIIMKLSENLFYKTTIYTIMQNMFKNQLTPDH